MKRIITGFLLVSILVSCGQPSSDARNYEDFRRRVDKCIVEHGVGPGVKDYCEALASTNSTPVPKGK